jgi:hypothetical protein
MYRPNRIGPWPLVAIDTAPLDMGTLGGAVGDDVCSPHLPDTTIRSAMATRQMRALTSGAMAANSHLDIGVAVNGSNPNGGEGAADDPSFVISVAGVVVVRTVSGAGPISVVPFLARNNAATIVAFGTGGNACTNFNYLPGESVMLDQDVVQCRINMSLIMGNHDGAVTPSVNPLIFGFGAWNRSAATAQYKMQAHLSIHKYEQDLDVFDPTRT